jgi:DUF971 family protein
MAESEALVPRIMKRDGDGLRITWSDGRIGFVPFREMRAACPCASCNEERAQPPDPFRVLKANELAAGPPVPVAMPRRGYYAYQVVWNDGHDAGIYSLEKLLSLCRFDDHAPTSS